MSGAPAWGHVAARRRPRAGLALLVVAAALVAAGLGRLAEPPIPPQPGDLQGDQPVPVATAPPSDEVDAPGGEVDGGWEPIAEAPFTLRFPAPAVWTGSQLVVWTGQQDDPGAAWYADADFWSPLPEAPVSRRAGWTATRTDDDVIFVGGIIGDEMPRDAWAYDPEEARWRVLSPMPVRGRVQHGAAWTGEHLYIWGGRGRFDTRSEYLVDGAAYHPATDRWTTLPPAPLSPRTSPVVVWLADRRALLVWGGRDVHGPRSDGALYEEDTGRWRMIADAPVSFLRAPAAASDGSRLLVWGLPDAGLHERSGWEYRPVRDRWRPLPRLLNQERDAAAATWAVGEPGGRFAEPRGQFVVWGGFDRRLQRTRHDGFAVEPATWRWRQIPEAPIDRRSDATITWIDTDLRQGLLVWGGRWRQSIRTDGAFYPGPAVRPAADAEGD